MSTKTYSYEFKKDIIEAFEKRECTISEFCLQYDITEISLRKWIEKYERYGVESLQRSTTWKPYSKALKEAVVLDYLSGKHSQYEIVEKYEISSRGVLQKWINKYNHHRELKDTSKGRTNSMTSKRNTTWEERIDIALDCLKNGKNYQETATVHQVSYQQVYQWVKKYEDGGEEALKDRRGKKKQEEELTPEEIVSRQMKKLEEENERLRAENLFLKKLEEIERRRK
ncbi:transposase [Jeotgalibacillus proteolyticus]|uniref:Transposase n=1 Tax=Jeotgalibacillus proteolyticus TaxID=2082395 RepID=A0A2S5GGW6_9BACL|nr:helix-turn-helix domain-containing protein [Jeotgalibacillus proteolyticus]PPA72229.1 transposase [Jeotgalibacillus proteolyticus]